MGAYYKAMSADRYPLPAGCEGKECEGKGVDIFQSHDNAMLNHAGFSSRMPIKVFFILGHRRTFRYKHCIFSLCLIIILCNIVIADVTLT